MLAAQVEKVNAITSAQCEDATSGRSSEASGVTGSAHYFATKITSGQSSEGSGLTGSAPRFRDDAEDHTSCPRKLRRKRKRNAAEVLTTTSRGGPTILFSPTAGHSQTIVNLTSSIKLFAHRDANLGMQLVKKVRQEFNNPPGPETFLEVLPSKGKIFLF